MLLTDEALGQGEPLVLLRARRHPLAPRLAALLELLICSTLSRSLHLQAGSASVCLARILTMVDLRCLYLSRVSFVPQKLAEGEKGERGEDRVWLGMVNWESG